MTRRSILIQHPISMELIKWIINDAINGVVMSRGLISILIIKAVKYQTLHKISHKRYKIDKSGSYYEILDNGNLIKLHTVKPIFAEGRYETSTDEVSTYHILDYIKGVEYHELCTI